MTIVLLSVIKVKDIFFKDFATVLDDAQVPCDRKFPWWYKVKVLIIRRGLIASFTKTELTG